MSNSVALTATAAPVTGPGTVVVIRVPSAIARAAGLEPAAMALAFIASKPYVTSVIMGATTTAQLGINLGAATLKLPRDVMRAIDAVHEEIPLSLIHISEPTRPY